MKRSPPCMLGTAHACIYRHKCTNVGWFEADNGRDLTDVATGCTFTGKKKKKGPKYKADFFFFV